MINIIRGGCTNKHPNSFKMSRPNGFNHHVLLIVKSDSEFWIEDNHIIASPSQAIIIKPDTSYSYHNPNGEYINDWLHFDVDDNTELERLFPLTNTLIPLSDMDVCSGILQQIFWESSYTSKEYAKENIEALFKVLLNHISYNHANRDTIHLLSPFYSELCAIRLNMKNTIGDEHCIKKYADMLHISESYFQHLYTEQFGISFQKDLIHARIEYAKTMLHSSDATINQIAAMCGYNNEVHFYRQFKEIACTTPAHYRKNLL